MKRNFQWILLSLILLLGILIRAWNFGSLPSGLNQDEASSAVDAYYLYHYGVDRNGISYPVHFIAWGSGQSLLYGYLLIPFVASGLNPITTRLPMLLLGVLTLPIMYLVGYRTAGRRFALIAVFLLAVSPWHIMMSRWGLEDNTLPFVFLVGYLCMLLSTRNNHWYAAGCGGCHWHANRGQYQRIKRWILPCKATPTNLCASRTRSTCRIFTFYSVKKQTR
ncbi:MAG: glycosyltransferase family 39 protein [Anaerolineales bacterium]|nr:glycosyltransferase family 39 protein [Anaerolineales bacterium]